MGFNRKNKRGGRSGRSAHSRPSNPPPPPEQRTTGEINRPPQQATRSAAASPQATHSAAVGTAVNPRGSGSATTAAQDPVQESSEADQERRKEIKARVKRNKKLGDVWILFHDENKRKFLRINIAKLRTHLKRAYSESENYESLVRIFNEAILYVSEKKDNCWEVFLCPHPDCHEYQMTSAKMRFNHILEKHFGGWQDVYTYYAVIKEWAKIVKDGKWEPIDIARAKPIIQSLKPNCLNEDIKNQKWPTYRDRDISGLLEEIREMLGKLIWEKRCLTPSNIATMMDYSAKNILSEPHLKHLVCKMSGVNIPIRCLTKNRLETLLNYLQGLFVDSDSIDQLPDEVGRCFRPLDDEAKESEVKESIRLDQKRSFLLLDESLINKSSSTTSSSTTFIHWLLSGNSISPQWEQLKADNMRLLNECLQTYDRAGEILQTSIKSRNDVEAVHESFSSLKSMCDAELGMRMEPTRDRISYLCLLKKRQGELVVGDGPEFDAIKQVLEKFGFGSDVDLASMESKNGDLLQEDDSVVNFLVLCIINEVSKWNKCDVKMMRIYSAMGSLMARLVHLPGLDYRAILLPIIKSFLKEKLENLAPKEEANEETSDCNFQIVLEEVRAQLNILPTTDDSGDKF